MDLNLPIPAEAADMVVEGHNGTARVDGYEWQAVAMIAAAELDRFAEAVEATYHCHPRGPSQDGYAAGWGDFKADLLDALRSRAVLLRSRAGEVDDAGGDPDALAG
jgi:hypothetical protein